MQTEAKTVARTSGLRRSLFFVPGAEPRKLEKARSVGADTLLFDLEDAVAPEEKSRARDLVAQALQKGGFGQAEPAVRVNAPGTRWFEEDLEIVVGAGAATVMIPKSEASAELREVAGSLERLGPGSERRVRILALVETAAGVARVLDVAAATPRIEAVCFGHVDFAREMGLAEADSAQGVVLHARCEVVIAGRACGVTPIDTVHLAVRDEIAFRRDAELGLSLGFEGKLCIHPAQVQIANQVYTPTPEQIDYALRVTEAAEQARAEGRGVFTLDGRMVDAPVVAAQDRVLERARRAGALKGR